MGHVLTKNKKSIYIDPKQGFINWKKEMLEFSSNECLFSCVYENEIYYAEASSFFEKKQDESVGFKIYRKSVINYEINKKKTKEECSICLNKLQSCFCKKYITLECGHSFHKNCIEKHATTKRNENITITCPLCRFGESHDEIEIARLKKIKQEQDDNRSDSISYDSD